MEALMTNLIRLSRQRLKQFMPDKIHDPDDVMKTGQSRETSDERKLSLPEIDFDPSYLLSLLLQQLKIPFIRVRLGTCDFDMQIVSEKGEVISTVPCSYEDDGAILDCIDNRQIPDCIQDLLLHPQARKIFWNGLVFVEICHKYLESEKNMVSFKVTTVLKCSINMLLCYAENALSFADQSKNNHDSKLSELKTEENLLMALYPNLDLEVPSSSNIDNSTGSPRAKYQRLQLCGSKWKSRFRSASKSQIPHVVEKLRKKYPLQNRFKHFSSTQLRKTKFRSLLDESFCKVPEQSADILSKKWKDMHALYRLKNPESVSKSGSFESDQNQSFSVNHIPKPQTKIPGFCVLPEEKHTIEALGSSHCAEIVVSRRSADNFYFGQLKVMSRQRVTNESLKGATSATVASSPTRGDSSNSAANERLCEFELGSRQSVNKYIVEYLRMIADRDRTPKHSITNLRK